MTWALQFQAEDRTQKEQFVRVNRDGYSSYKLAVASATQGAPPDHAFDPLRHWTYVFGECLSDKYRNWWKEQLEDPALIIIATPARVGDL